MQTSDTTFTHAQAGQVDDDLGSPFVDDPDFVDDPEVLIQDPVTEFDREELTTDKLVHDGKLIPWGARAPWRDYPDEYLCDGGDAYLPVQVLNDGSLRNLEPEDAVGLFESVKGRIVVQPSNRVYIYAPRFAATRKLTAAHESEALDQPVTTEAPTVPVTHKLSQDSNLLKQNLAPQRHLAIQSATTFRDRTPATEASQRQALIVVSGDVSAHEDFRVIRTGFHKQVEKPELVEFVDAAISWSHDAAVQVVIDKVVAQTRVTVDGIEEYFSFGVKGSPKLRLIKTASQADALPGEVIEFTLRFDNVGHQPMENVTITDNLTTRLEYVKGTAECSLDAEFSVDENEVESLTLRWEIAEPLNVGEGGIIRFKSRVR